MREFIRMIIGEINRPSLLIEISEHINTELKSIERLSSLTPQSRLSCEWLDIELNSVIERRNDLIDLYNRYKYWWMRRK